MRPKERTQRPPPPVPLGRGQPLTKGGDKEEVAQVGGGGRAAAAAGDEAAGVFAAAGVFVEGVGAGEGRFEVEGCAGGTEGILGRGGGRGLVGCAWVGTSGGGIGGGGRRGVGDRLRVGGGG